MSKLLSQEQIDFYFREGFLHVPNVYPASTIDRIRELAAEKLKDGSWYDEPRYANEGVTSDIYRTMPELVDLVFTEKYVQVFKELFGEKMVILPEPALHRNRFYGWHKDSTFIDQQGEEYHWKDDFNAIMAAMYLQDNDPDLGGGISVVPRTHHTRDVFHKIFKQNVAQRAVAKVQKMLGMHHFNKLDSNKELTRVPTKKGDLVLLDLRCDHKGSTARIKPKDFEKYALFNIVTDNMKYVKDLNRCLRARPGAYYSQYLKHDTELPQSIIEKSKTLNFNVDF